MVNGYAYSVDSKLLEIGTMYVIFNVEKLLQFMGCKVVQRGVEKVSAV